MSKKRVQQPSDAAAASPGATPWWGRLRTHHTPQRRRWSPPRIASRIENQVDEKEGARMFKKPAAPKNPKGGCLADGTRAACPPADRRRSLRLAARDLEHLLSLEVPTKDCKVKCNPSVVMPLRRSRRLRPEIKTGDTKPSNGKLVADKSCGKASPKNENYLNLPPLSPIPQESSHNIRTPNAIGRNKKKKKPELELKIGESTRKTRSITGLKPSLKTPNPQGFAPKKMVQIASCEKGKKQELKHKVCKVTKKRKRSSEGKPSPKKKCHSLLPCRPQEIAPKNEAENAICKKGESKPTSVVQPKVSERSRNIETSTEEANGIETDGMQEVCGSDVWTEQQDIALRQAYFMAQPSPHFWKKVSKMVPGKSAEECFNRVHADLATPTPIAPRSRLSKTKFSPLGHFTLSDPKLPSLLESKVGRQRTTKQKSLAAQKTVRHLLKKQCLIDQAQEADHFSVFETSPSALKLDISFDSSPGTPDSFLNSGLLCKCSESSLEHKRPLSRFKNKHSESSPAVLKPVKNVALHEKYIDQLSRREAVKRHRKKASSSNPADSVKTGPELQASDLKAAKTALISEATDFISHFKKLQANSHVNCMTNSEDDEYDDIECDIDENYCD